MLICYNSVFLFTKLQRIKNVFFLKMNDSITISFTHIFNIIVFHKLKRSLSSYDKGICVTCSEN